MSDLAVRFTPLLPSDRAAIDRLEARVFGPGRFSRTAYRLRETAPADQSLSFVARIGSMLIGSNLMTAIRCGEATALLLGPLTVEPAFRQRGIGETLVRTSLEAAGAAGHRFVLLVGDEPYYGRMGFRHVPPGQVTMPGPVDPARLLVCELVPGAFAGVTGAVRSA